MVFKMVGAFYSLGSPIVSQGLCSQSGAIQRCFASLKTVNIRYIKNVVYLILRDFLISISAFTQMLPTTYLNGWQFCTVL